MESDGFPEFSTWTGWLGPVWSTLTRPGANGDVDPDDPDHHDLTTVPELTFITPKIPGIDGPEAMVLTLAGTTPLADIVRTVREELGRARAAKVAALVNGAKCSLCGDSYPAAHLLPTTEHDRLVLSNFPSSHAFDGNGLRNGSVPIRLGGPPPRLYGSSSARTKQLYPETWGVR